mgnify:FL=1
MVSVSEVTGAMQIGLAPDTVLLTVSSVFISDVNTRSPGTSCQLN